MSILSDSVENMAKDVRSNRSQEAELNLKVYLVKWTFLITFINKNKKPNSFLLNLLAQLCYNKQIKQFQTAKTSKETKYNYTSA